ncbi:MAG: hypothetical protein NW226_05815 [Microscillaceae bacterium]|nr:hypothetical protein [Microscillaceae bacterium]
MKIKLFEIFVFIGILYIAGACSDSGGGEPEPDNTLNEESLSAQEWALVEFNGTSKGYISGLEDPNTADDTLRFEWDYLECVGVLVCDGNCNKDNTLKFTASNNRYEMRTNAISCSNGSQTEQLEDDPTNTFEINREGDKVYLDFKQFISLENAFFLNTDATYKNFNFNSLSSPYRFELLEGDNSSDVLKLRFTHFWEGEDVTFGSASSYRVEVNLTMQKVN